LRLNLEGEGTAVVRTTVMYASEAVALLQSFETIWWDAADETLIFGPETPGRGVGHPPKRKKQR
jgi:hypothetical protein